MTEDEIRSDERHKVCQDIQRHWPHVMVAQDVLLRLIQRNELPKYDPTKLESLSRPTVVHSPKSAPKENKWISQLNVIISNEWFDPVRDAELIKILFSPLPEEEIGIRDSSIDMLDLLVELGAFPSRGQARKNWKEGPAIPKGFSHFVVGKTRRELTIWNPIQD